jgi:DNA polymerase-3 subunit delta
MKVDARSVERIVSTPDPKVRVVLIYGEDEGLVAERAERFAKAVTGGDPLGRVRLEMEALGENPGRLADEANAIPMFGGHRVIMLRLAGNRRIDAAVEAVLELPPVDAWVLVTAGDLRKDSPLLRILEPHAGAAVIRCFVDADRDLDRLIDDELKAAGLTIDADARVALRGLLGGDRGTSRSELAKLCLYAAGKVTITLADVQAAMGDVAAFDLDEILDAITAGDGAGFDRAYRRLLVSGAASFQVVSAATRHFNYLEVARAAFDNGVPARSVVERGRPPVYGPRAARVADTISRWPLTRIRHAQRILDQALFDSRLRGAIADEVVGQALLMVATLAPRRAQAS